MADAKQLKLLKSGVEAWNKWRQKDPYTKPNLSGADLRGANFIEADLRGANLSRANLSGADLFQADLSGADLVAADLSDATLRKANLSHAILFRTNLRKADLGDANLSFTKYKNTNFQEANLNLTNLMGAFFHNAKLSYANLRESILSEAVFVGATDLRVADLRGANLSRLDLRGLNFTGADLTGADLRGADLTGADLNSAWLINTNLVEAKIENANISNSKIYGVNVWDLQGEFKEQNQLIITPDGISEITVDNIKVAQFVYLIINNKAIRDVLNTLTTKTVLILGRFADPNRKVVLDGLRSKLREYNLLPIVFDFDRPTDRDYTETVQTLASLSLFTIVDVTSPKSTPLEMEATVKQFKIPYVPIIDISVDPRPFAMIVDSQNSFHWVLPTFGYKSKEELLDNIETIVINRALEKHNQLREQKANIQEVLTLDDLKKG